MFDTDRGTGTPAEYIARRANTVGEMFLKRVERDGDKPAFYFKEGGEWQPVGWNAFAEQAGAIASYLLGLGLQIQDKVCRPRRHEGRVRRGHRRDQQDPRAAGRAHEARKGDCLGHHWR